MNRARRCVLAVLASAVVSSACGSTRPVGPPSKPPQTYTLLPVRDNTLYEDPTGSLSNGAGEHLFAGRAGTGGGGRKGRAVLAFAVADSIPAGSLIETAFLTLHMSKTRAGATRVKIYRISKNWGEGTSNATARGGGQGAPATLGDATWVHSFYNIDLWANLGGDFSAAASAEEVVDSVGFYTWGPTPEMAGDVQQWLDDPLTDFGWIVVGEELFPATAKRFDSRENIVPESRPVLTVRAKPPLN